MFVGWSAVVWCSLPQVQNLRGTYLPPGMPAAALNAIPSSMKKRRYWPKFCDVAGLVAGLSANAIGTVVCQTGKFLGHCVGLHADYNHAFMSNFGLMTQDGAA